MQAHPDDSSAYLIPAFLIVLLVGAVGILVVGVIRFFTRLLGTTAG